MERTGSVTEEIGGRQKLAILIFVLLAGSSGTQRERLRTVGTAMGSHVVPPYANIFMAFFEEKYVYTHNLYIQHSVHWKRFIDDVFLIWTGDEASLLQFFQDMNSMIPNLIFAIARDNYQINFLDTLVVVKEGGTLDIDLYTKPTDRNSLLYFSSCHPAHIKRSLPKSQIEHVKRIVTNPDVREQRISEMQTKFRDRGYPSTVLDRATVQLVVRSHESRRIAFVTTYHPYTNFFKSCILEHWPLLGKAYPAISEFSSTPLLCYKKPQNITNILVRADIVSTRRELRQATLTTQRKGTFPCLIARNALTSSRVRLFPIHDQANCFRFKVFFTCDSTYVIYLIKCPCSLGYVGETTQHIRDRISQHKSMIHCRRTLLPVTAHFISAGHSVSQLRFQVLETIPSPRCLRLKKKTLKKSYVHRRVFYHQSETEQDAGTVVLAEQTPLRQDKNGRPQQTRIEIPPVQQRKLDS
ncbi:unnamed protein product [Ranitomeya imitator]|uniref:Helix-turn-helix domain-containing protein n=1 Tax=Ranitomeya imitator TaxID=111125 RepID=A0ABN9KW07_9NEOB|nr:unnamed protein product [Ranitomeya imitator]